MGPGERLSCASSYRRELGAGLVRGAFTLGNLIRLVLLCLVVGLVLTALGVGPGEFWQGVGDAFTWAGRELRALYEWGKDYVLIGAAIVVPIVVVRYAWRHFSGR